MSLHLVLSLSVRAGWFEFKRIMAERSFWLWAYLGMPILLPVVFSAIAILAVSTQLAKPDVTTRQVIGAYGIPAQIQEDITSKGVEVRVVDDPMSLAEGIRQRQIALGLHSDRELQEVQILILPKAKSLPVFAKVESSLNLYAQELSADAQRSLGISKEDYLRMVSPVSISVETIEAHNVMRTDIDVYEGVLFTVFSLFPFAIVFWNALPRLLKDQDSERSRFYNHTYNSRCSQFLSRTLALYLATLISMVVSVLWATLGFEALGFLGMIVSEGENLNNMSVYGAQTANTWLQTIPNMWTSMDGWLLVGLKALGLGIVSCGLLSAVASMTATPHTLRLVSVVPLLGLLTFGLNL